MQQNPYEAPKGRGGGESNALPAPAMSGEQETGRLIVLVHIALVVGISIGLIAWSLAVRAPERLPAQIVRFALTVALCFWLYWGSARAKSIAFVLCGLTGLGSVLALVGTIRTGAGPVQFSIFGAMAAVYLSFAFVLIASPSVEAFFDYHASRKQARRAGSD
jgi:hypothetical protein